jgi:aryl carrier-like protein
VDWTGPLRMSNRDWKECSMTPEQDLVRLVVSNIEEVFERPIGENDDFFSAGGDSLKAVELAERLHSLTGEDLDVFRLWESGTLLEFALDFAKGHRELP